MSDFNNRLGAMISANDKQGMREWIIEMNGKIPRCTDEECKILSRRIRILEDYLKDDEESERDI